MNYRNLFGLLIALALAGPLTALAASADWAYTVRPGDNIWELANRFCGSHSKARLLVTRNRLSDPASLVAGERIFVPVECLSKQPASAQVVQPGGADLEREGVRRPLLPGEEIRMGDSVHSAAGFVVIRFADESLLTVRPQSSVSFILISAFGETGMVDTLVRVGRGRVQHVVNGESKGSRHRIATPVGIAAVRGTRYRVSLDDQQDGGPLATVATTDGEVSFESEGKQDLPLPAGMGVVATRQSAVKEALLPAPSLPADTGIAAGNVLSWPAVAGAVGYRVTAFAADEPVYESVAEGNELLPELSPGRYVVRVRGVAASGLEGLDGSTTLTVSGPPPSALNHELTERGVDLQWSPQAHADAYLLETRLVDSGMWKRAEVAQNFVSLNLDAGAYQWRVAHTDGQWSETAEFAVPPAPVAGLAANRPERRAPVVVTWDSAAQQPETEYLVQLARDEGFSEDSIVASAVVAENRAELQSPFCGDCVVRVAVHTNGAKSAYSSAAFEDTPGHPWPLYIILLSILVAL